MLSATAMTSRRRRWAVKELRRLVAFRPDCVKTGFLNFEV